MEKMRNYLSLPHSLNLKNFSFFQFFILSIFHSFNFSISRISHSFILSIFQFFNFKNFSFSHSFNSSISRISHYLILSIFQFFCASRKRILVSTCLVL